jgi:hypothetical protein
MPVRTADQTSATVTLPAATAVETTLSLALARCWTLHVHNTGSTNAITAIRYRRRLRAGEARVGPWIALTASLPLAAAGAWELQVDGDAAEEIDVELTSTAGTTALLSVVGV